MTVSKALTFKPGPGTRDSGLGTRDSGKAASSRLPPPAFRLPPSARGFSLIEMLVVLVILGIIASLIVPNILGRLQGAKVKAAKAQITQLSSAVDAYYLDNGSLPGDLQDLVNEPASATFWNGPYVKEALLQDPWGRTWEYRVPGENGRMYDLFSLGADSAPGGEGENADIRAW